MFLTRCLQSLWSLALVWGISHPPCLSWGCLWADHHWNLVTFICILIVCHVIKKYLAFKIIVIFRLWLLPIPPSKPSHISPLFLSNLWLLIFIAVTCIYVQRYIFTLTLACPSSVYGFVCFIFVVALYSEEYKARASQSSISLIKGTILFPVGCHQDCLTNISLPSFYFYRLKCRILQVTGWLCFLS